MSVVLALAEDDLPLPRRARHLYLAAVDGCLTEHADREIAANGNVNYKDPCAKVTTLPDGTSTTMEYGFGKDGFDSQRFKTTVTDDLGNKKQSYRDVRELITTVVEENRPFNALGEATSQSKAPIVTRYVYDPLRQITSVIDAQGNTTSVEYDNLGRRTAIDNPDTGKVETVYDLASNPIKKITANLRAMGADKAIEYDYDHTRLVAIKHPLYPDANVSYTYGTDADRAHNQAGRIKSVTHQSGTETREYGTLGETVSETLTLTAAANGGSTPPVYTTQYSFDSFGRLHTVTNPDGEVITHRYDSGGNLNAIDGRLNGHPYQYLERLDYDKFEQRVYLKVGNGVETKYTYRPDNRRLQTLQAGLPGKDWMQDIAYGYDNVGNITSLIDSAPIPKSNVYGGQSTQHFDYDDLYRLVKADGVYTTAREEQKYTLAMAYDAIHNITHKNQLHTVGKVGGTSPKTETATTYDWGYSYKDNNHTQPHAPTHIGERTFEYDANGNQRGWQNDTNGSRRTIVWDEDNRIREVQDPKHGAAFTYDDKGERKLRKSQYGETAYINQYFSVRNGAIASTHVYAGTSRIVTKVGAGTPVGKVSATTIQGTGNLTDTGTTMGDVIVITADGTTTTGSATTSSTTTSTTLSPASGRELERGQSGEGSFPGQGLEHRSDRANEVARNTQKNKHLNGGIPGGEHGSANSNKGGHGNAAGTSNNPGADTGTGGGDTGGDSGTGGNIGGNTTGGTGTGDGMEFIYFYHPDHLGSTGYVTDEKAQRYEHITYFPFGETWVQEATATWRVPYQFTSKEMDPETGLYYFGARYYDPRTSVFQSADPILGQYLNGQPNGGAYNSTNVNLYRYAAQNPLRVTDPTGKSDCSECDEVMASRQKILDRVESVKEGMSTAGDVLEAAAPVPGAAVLGVATKGNKIWNAISKFFGGKGDDVAKTAASVPGRVQSRINISNEGMEHTLSRHLNPAKAENKSQFAVPESELRSLLSAKSTVEAPATVLETGNFARTITLDKPVGNLAEKMGGGPTNTFTVITDKFGNLQSAFPGGL